MGGGAPQCPPALATPVSGTPPGTLPGASPLRGRGRAWEFPPKGGNEPSAPKVRVRLSEHPGARAIERPNNHFNFTRPSHTRPEGF